jgi:hypothetical protein
MAYQGIVLWIGVEDREERKMEMCAIFGRKFSKENYQFVE